MRKAQYSTAHGEQTPFESEKHLIAKSAPGMWTGIDNTYPPKFQGRHLKVIKKMLKLIENRRDVEIELIDTGGHSLEFKVTFCS